MSLRLYRSSCKQFGSEFWDSRGYCFDELGIGGLFAADLARVSGLEARSGELSLLPFEEIFSSCGKGEAGCEL